MTSLYSFTPANNMHYIIIWVIEMQCLVSVSQTSTENLLKCERSLSPPGITSGSVVVRRWYHLPTTMSTLICRGNASHDRALARLQHQLSFLSLHYRSTLSDVPPSLILTSQSQSSVRVTWGFISQSQLSVVSHGSSIIKYTLGDWQFLSSPWLPNP